MTDVATSSQDIPLASLTLEDDLQPRCEIDLGLIEHYAALLMEGVALPPVVVFQEGERLLLADGFHRLRAHQVLERTAISSLVHSGTRLDAVRYSLSANATHGKPRTRGDMARAYKTAKRLGLVTPGDVGGLRDLLQCSFRWARNLTQVDREIARHERDSVILQKRAEGKSQRQIARETGIPQQTVNDVLKGVTENGTVPFSVTSDDGAAALPRFEDVIDRQALHDWCRVIKALEAFGDLRPIPHLFRNPCPQVFYAVEEALPAATGWLKQFEEEFRHVQLSQPA